MKTGNIIRMLVMAIIILAGCSRETVPEGEGKVIILMYHSITDGEPEDLYERSAADFERDLQYLKKNNIDVINFETFENMVKKGIRPHDNKAILTFDDGYHTWLTNVKPLLIKYEMEGTFFICTSMIGTELFLSWEEVELLSHYTDKNGKRPFVFASHTVTHPFLQAKKSSFSDPADYNAFLDDELGGSKELIEDVTPLEVKVLALPYGDGAGNEDIINAAARNGYTCIRTSRWDAVDLTEVDLFDLPSLPMLDASEPEIIGEYLGL